MFDFPPTLTLFIAYIGTSGFAAMVMSSLVETLPFWTQWDAKPWGATAKKLIMIGVYLGLALLSNGLVHWVPTGVLESLQPYYAIIIGVISTWFAGTGFHFLMNRRPSAAKAKFKTLTVRPGQAIPPVEQLPPPAAG